MIKERLVIVVFSVVVAIIAWVFSAYVWGSKRIWIPEVPEIKRLLIGLTVWTNIAVLFLVFIVVYSLLLVLTSKTMLSK